MGGATLLTRINLSCWDAYYQSYLQVVHDESITISGYILNTCELPIYSHFSPFSSLRAFTVHLGEKSLYSQPQKSIYTKVLFNLALRSFY